MVSEIGRKDDQDKLMYDLLDPKFEDAIVEILTHGAKKYAKDNWKKVEPFEDRYYSALRRHLSAWRKGEMIDPDSGLHHLAHCATNIYFLYMRSIENEHKPTGSCWI